MKKQILLLLLMLVGFGVQAQNLSWVNPINPINSIVQTPTSVAVDANGNSYTTFVAQGTFTYQNLVQQEYYYGNIILVFLVMLV